MVSRNDHIIEQMLSDPTITVTEDGKVWRKIGKRIVETGYAAKRSTGSKKRVKIRYRGKRVFRSRIVYAKFNGPLDENLTVDHINGDTLDDRPENLQLMTQLDNSLKYIESIGQSVIDITIATNIKLSFARGKTILQLVKDFNLNLDHVQRIVEGKAWKQAGREYGLEGKLTRSRAKTWCVNMDYVSDIKRGKG